VDFDAAGLREVRRRELAQPRALATVTGRIDDLLGDSAYDALVDCFLSVTLTDPVRPIDAMRTLRERFPHAVHVDWAPEGGVRDAGLRYAEAVRGKDDTEIVRGFLADCRGATPTEDEAVLLDEALIAAGKSEIGDSAERPRAGAAR
jgi:DNA repair protein SbcD/Mre11